MFYRLVAWDTIEEKVRALKARLFSTVLDDGNAFGTTLPVDGIRPARLTARLQCTGPRVRDRASSAWSRASGPQAYTTDASGLRRARRRAG